MNLLHRLEREGCKVVGVDSLSRALGIARSSVRVALRRLQEKGLLLRVGRKFVVIGVAEPHEIAFTAFAPCYASMEYALSRHGIIDQTVMVCTCVVLTKSRRIEAGPYTFELHRFPKSLFFGYGPDGLAEAEKALLDFFYVGKDPRQFSWSLDSLDFEKLSEYAKAYPEKVRVALSEFMRSSSSTYR